ncbi:MAG: glycoside hydrolase family 5 protein [Burkholderiales bacterium]|nr:glycoside hydrolase family 5 protein [Burkholderiales bacterium]
MKSFWRACAAFTLVASVLALATTTVAHSGQSPDSSVIDSAAPRLHVDGKHFKNAAGEVVVLRGLSLIELHDLHLNRSGHRFTIDLVTDRTRGWFPTVLRLPVFPDYYLPDPAGYVEKYLHPAVQYCTAKGLYCIIDWHYGVSPFERDRETRRFWKDIAPRYKDYPNVLYEIFNELDTTKWVTGRLWRKWRDQAQQWVDLIREAAPENIVLIGGPYWSHQIRGAAEYPLAGRNLAYVAHVYPGGHYPNFFGWNLGVDGWERNIGEVADKHPVFITEWGYGFSEGSEVNGTRANFGRPFKKWADEKGVSWTAWVADYDWRPVMFDRDWELTEFGKFVHEWLRENAGPPPGRRRTGE